MHITRITGKDSQILAELAKQTFLESHGHSATPEDIHDYIAKTYNEDAILNEINDPGNLYYFIFKGERPAGFSKIVMNAPYPGSDINNIAKMDRFYLLKEFYNQNLGAVLFEFNMKLCRENNQKGVWLYVWTENDRAVRFYLKQGFRINGSHNFRISATHFNPNHLMLLIFEQTFVKEIQ